MTATLTDTRTTNDIMKNFREVYGIPDDSIAIFTFKNDISFEQSFRKLQEVMAGAAEEMGLKNEDDVVALIKEIRAEL